MDLNAILAEGVNHAASDIHLKFGVSRIESIMLYRSHLSPESSSYQALATFLFRRLA